MFLPLRVPPIVFAQSVSTRLFRCTGGARAAHRWKCLRDPRGVGRTARTDLDTDSGVEPAGSVAARRTIAMARDLATATAPGPHPAGRDVPAVPNLDSKIGTRALNWSGGRSVGRPDPSIRDGLEGDGVALFPKRRCHSRPAFLAGGRCQRCRSLETASAANTGRLGHRPAATNLAGDAASTAGSGPRATETPSHPYRRQRNLLAHHPNAPAPSRARREREQKAEQHLEQCAGPGQQSTTPRSHWA